MNKLTKVKIRLNELDIFELKLGNLGLLEIKLSNSDKWQEVCTASFHFSLKLESDQSGKLVFFFSCVHYLQFPNTITQGQGKVR